MRGAYASAFSETVSTHLNVAPDAGAVGTTVCSRACESGCDARQVGVRLRAVRGI